MGKSIVTGLFGGKSPLKFFLLAVGDQTRASSRLRVWHHENWFAEQGAVVADYVVPRNIGGVGLLLRILKRYPAWFSSFVSSDVVIIQETLVLSPVLLISSFFKPKFVIFDFSDPIDRHGKGLKGYLRKLGFKIMIRCSQHVMVENRRYLSDPALSRKPRSSFYGPVDARRLRCAGAGEKPRQSFRIGWTGSPSTIHFLDPIFPVLDRLSETYDIELALMGCGNVPYNFQNLKVVELPWSEDGEFEFLPTLDLGLFALERTEDGARRGAGKLFLYLAAGIPFVAVDWGIASDLIQETRIGFPVKSEEDWKDVLIHALTSEGERLRFASCGLQYAEEKLSYEVYRDHIISIVRTQS